MIPPFDERGNLPPGIHKASWTEVEARFGTTPWRRSLLLGLRDAVDHLENALDLSRGREAQKRRFRGELLPADIAADSDGVPYLDYFQRESNTNRPKGIVSIDLARTR